MTSVTSEGATVAVIVGTYNGDRFLAAQLDSLLTQSKPPAEIIISDDGSTDSTMALLERFSTSTTIPVTLIRNPVNLGFSENFLHAASLSSSKYIAFCDQDDVWRDDKLEMSVDLLEEHNGLLCTHAVKIFDTDVPPPAERTKRDDSLAKVLEPLTANPWEDHYGFTMVVNALLLDLIPMDMRGPDTHKPETSLSHDRWIWVLATAFGRTVEIPQVLAFYRRHGEQLFGSHEGRTSWLQDKRSWIRHIVRGVKGIPVRVDFLIDVCDARAQLFATINLLDRTTEISPFIEAMAPVRAAQFWKALAASSRARRHLYSRSRVTRVPHIIMEVIRGTYRATTRGGCGRRSLAQDLFALFPVGAIYRHLARGKPPGIES